MQIEIEISPNDSPQWKKLVIAFEKCLDNVIKRSNPKKLRSFFESSTSREIAEKLCPQFSQKVLVLSKQEFAKLCKENHLRENLNNLLKEGEEENMEKEPK